jgi:hypothetical protein
MKAMSVRLSSHAVSLLLLGGLLTACSSEPRDDQASPVPQSQPAAPAASAKPSVKVAYAGELPPLPISNFPAARPPQIVNAVYEFAARKPDVLRYVPCFCGCERNGHTHNADCFVASREPDGKPRWDAHGLS